MELRCYTTNQTVIARSVLSVSCNCLVVNVEKKIYEQNERIIVDMILKIPAIEKTPEFVQQISFSKDGAAQQKVDLPIRYEIKGLLNFIDRTTIAEVIGSGLTAIVKIPFTLSEPVSMSRVVATANPESSARMISVEAGEGKILVTEAIRDTGGPNPTQTH